ncbi:FliC/FljB family flagellin [Vreelandella sp. 21]|uniref:FliC/FljB family flagellin n=1 Tax=Vreelandella sp. 21 TaxID=3402864 RepID=UPI003D9AA807
MSVINTNITSMIGQSNLSKSQNALTTSMERLSSGLRINSAKDDAAGQAIANRMTAQITGLAQAQRNANDGISVAQTAEGALNQVNDNVQRIRELAVQSTNGTNSQNDLQSIQDEINQRLDEIDRISEETDFNGVKVLDSGVQSLSIQVGANDGETISVNLTAINRDTLGLDGFQLLDGIQESAVAGTNTATVEATTGLSAADFAAPGADVGSGSTGATGSFGDFLVDASGDYFVEYAGGEDTDGSGGASGGNGTYAVTVGGDGSLTLGAIASPAGATTVVEEATFDQTITGADAGNVYAYTGTYGNDPDDAPSYVIKDVDAEGNDVYFNANIAEDGEVTRGRELSVGDKDVDPMEQLDDALNTIDSLRSELGAVQNRFEDAITNLNTNETNLSSARSRIEDADYATEVANMTRAQILQQAGTSVLAQANQIPQNVLSLLG